MCCLESRSRAVGQFRSWAVSQLGSSTVGQFRSWAVSQFRSWAVSQFRSNSPLSAVRRLPSAVCLLFIDLVTVRVTAGTGGSGCTSFRREKFAPMGGPDGGEGGKGGDVLVRGDANLATLLDFTYRDHWTAERAADWARSKDEQWTTNGYGPWALKVDGVFAGWGGFQRRSPIGGAAKGIPLNIRTPDFCRPVPSTVPFEVLTRSAARILLMKRVTRLIAAKSLIPVNSFIFIS